MKRFFMLFTALVGLGLLLLAGAFYLPATLPTDSDFGGLYLATVTFAHGISIYDRATILQNVTLITGLPAEQVFIPIFPYPPWTVLSTFYLAWLPAKVAAMLWFELNLLMLLVSIGLLTDGWVGRWRLLAFPLGLLFLPVVGALVVGQLGFPALLGAALFGYALRKANLAGTVLGAVLLLFKPHLGALMLLAGLGWLLRQPGAFRQRVLVALGVVGGGLLVSGFLVDPLWPVNYPKLLFFYQGTGNVTGCELCASWPVTVARGVGNGSLALGAGLAVVFLVGWLGLFFSTGTLGKQSPTGLVALAALTTLLVSPYLYNYDYILLLVPLAWLARSGAARWRGLALVALLVPTMALLAFGRAGNLALLLTTLALGLLLGWLLRHNGPEDLPPQPNFQPRNLQ